MILDRGGKALVRTVVVPRWSLKVSTCYKNMVVSTTEGMFKMPMQGFSVMKVLYQLRCNFSLI